MSAYAAPKPAARPGLTDDLVTEAHWLAVELRVALVGTEAERTFALPRAIERLEYIRAALMERES